jgi:ATP-dependent helicase/nuclease subunit B
MFDADPSRIFALPPGCDFPAELVAGLQRRLVGRPKQDMAKVTLYVNTARMRRRITDIFTQGGAGFLPKLRLIEDVDQDPAVDLPSPRFRSAAQIGTGQDDRGPTDRAARTCPAQRHL